MQRETHVRKQLVESVIAKSKIFSIEKTATVLDEYRYFSFDIRYPQEYQQAPCLRPFIKLEFIESTLLSAAESRSVQSIFAQMLKSDVEIKKLPCAAIIETQAEKLLSMMRRTASVARNSERDDDETLIRHVYDCNYPTQQNRAFCLPSSPEQMGKSCTGLLLSGLRKESQKRKASVISHQINLALLHHLCGPESDVWLKANFGTITHYGTKN